MLLKFPFVRSIASDIIKKTNTPVYAYSRKELILRLRSFQDAFAKQETLICYALKANSNAAICGVFSGMGAGADVVSGGELWRALKSGFPAKKIVFSGVGKTEGELAFAIRTGILMINVESSEEMLVLEKTAKAVRKKAPFSVRINPDVDPHTSKDITTGKLGTKFGVSLQEAFGMYCHAKTSKWLEITGMQCHLGSQISSVKPYSLALTVLLKLVDKLKACGMRISCIDMGGGWAVPEGGVPKPPALLTQGILPRLESRDIKLIIEPGRSLVASAGVLLTRVIYRKISGNRVFVVVDAAMNDFVRPSFYGAKCSILPLFCRKGKNVKFDIVGPICEPGDFLAKDVTMPMPKPGDILAVLSAGAYGFSMSSQYNSRGRAAEVMVDASGKRWKVIRKRETFEDLIRGEI